MEQFVIDFGYNDASYAGLVRLRDERGELFYSVHLERENQEFNLEVINK